jgi:hypothetical protein
MMADLVINKDGYVVCCLCGVSHPLDIRCVDAVRAAARLDGERTGVVKGLDMAIEIFKDSRPIEEFSVEFFILKIAQLKEDYLKEVGK